MNRQFTTREKVMLLLLTLVLIGMGYFKLILEPINLAVDNLNAQTADEDNLILQGMARVQEMKAMEKELEEIFAAGEPVPIPSYDNFGSLITELHAILDGTVDYSLAFPGVGSMSGGYIISRPVQLSFTATSYEQIRTVFNRIHDSVNENQISDLSISANYQKAAEGEQLEEGTFSVSMLITYFELMQ